MKAERIDTSTALLAAALLALGCGEAEPAPAPTPPEEKPTAAAEKTEPKTADRTDTTKSKEEEVTAAKKRAEQFMRKFIPAKLMQMSDLIDAGVDLGEKWQVTMIYCPQCRNVYAHTHIEDFPSNAMPCPDCGGTVARVAPEVYNTMIERKRRDP